MSQSEYSTKGRRYCHLQEPERKCIQRMKQNGASNNEIAKALGRHKSSIGRELKRNAVEQRETVYTHSKSIEIPLWREVRRYFWDSAQRLYHTRRLNTGAKSKLALCGDFVQYLEQKVLGPEKWSVDATVGYARRHHLFANIPCTRTGYNWIDAGLLKIRNIDLLLKVRRKTRKKAKERKRILGRSIEERPDYINQRQEFAHWEGDGIQGKGRKGHLLTLTERSIGYGIVWDAKDRGADKIVLLLDALEQQYGMYFPLLFKSITFDNGPEFSAVADIERDDRVTAYYAHPYSSYERGSNENWNGIVRRFIPKGKEISDLDPDILIRVNRYINQLPRKRFGYRSPEELFEQKLRDIITSADNQTGSAPCCTCFYNWGILCGWGIYAFFASAGASKSRRRAASRGWEERAAPRAKAGLPPPLMPQARINRARSGPGPWALAKVNSALSSPWAQSRAMIPGVSARALARASMPWASASKSAAVTSRPPAGRASAPLSRAGSRERAISRRRALRSRCRPLSFSRAAPAACGT